MCNFNLQEVFSGALMDLTNDNALFKLMLSSSTFQFGFSRMLLFNRLNL